VTLWRQLRAIGTLPGVVALVIPALLLTFVSEPDPGFGLGAAPTAAIVAAGIAVAVAGAALMYRTITLFSRVGEGTLAPWDPTSRLVVVGPYRHVRNPMITGVLCVLIGGGLALGSPAILIEAAVFFAVNATYMPLVEEPGLARRFGGEYEAYKRNVPRWIPRMRPWEPDGSGITPADGPRNGSRGGG
jgi:protein-S-isoprenylcysteine O-methyltransferase Ste14